MIPEKVHLDIVTPERRVVSRELDEVVLPGVEGSFGVLPGHAPMLSRPELVVELLVSLADETLHAPPT